MYYIRTMETTDREQQYKYAIAECHQEVLRASKLWPDFPSQHHGYAVILEEVDELWDEVKKNQRNYDLEAQRKEAIQAAAMLIRFAAELTPVGTPTIPF